MSSKKEELAIDILKIMNEKTAENAALMKLLKAIRNAESKTSRNEIDRKTPKSKNLTQNKNK